MGLIGKPLLQLPARSSCVEFSADESFTMEAAGGTSRWDGKMFWSTNLMTWTEWNAANAIQSQLFEGKYKVFIRGEGNTVATGNGTGSDNGAWHFSAPVTAKGILDTVLDWRKVLLGEPIAYGSETYTTLFAYKAASTAGIKDASELILRGANQLLMYNVAFKYNQSLVNPPRLPTENLGTSCYRQMFQGCTSLEKIHKLPTLTIPETAYQGMYRECTKIKISTSQTGEYQNVYRVPYDGTGTAGTNATDNMFTSTGGTFTGTPTVNTTYYTSNTVIS